MTEPQLNVVEQISPDMLKEFVTREGYHPSIHGTLASIDNYVQFGVPTGGFLKACISNDFKEAACRADSVNKLFLQDIAKYITNHMPAISQGSEDRYYKWCAAHQEIREKTEDKDER